MPNAKTLLGSVSFLILSGLSDKKNIKKVNRVAMKLPRFSDYLVLMTEIKQNKLTSICLLQYTSFPLDADKPDTPGLYEDRMQQQSNI